MRFKGHLEKQGTELCGETKVSSRITCSWSRCVDTPAEEGQAYSFSSWPFHLRQSYWRRTLLLCDLLALGPTLAEGPHSASLPLLVHSSALTILKTWVRFSQAFFSLAYSHPVPTITSHLAWFPTPPLPGSPLPPVFNLIIQCPKPG